MTLWALSLLFRLASSFNGVGNMLASYRKAEWWFGLQKRAKIDFLYFRILLLFCILGPVIVFESHFNIQVQFASCCYLYIHIYNAVLVCLVPCFCIYTPCPQSGPCDRQQVTVHNSCQKLQFVTAVYKNIMTTELFPKGCTERPHTMKPS